MKKLKIAILAIAVITGVSGAIASKAKRGGQYFYLQSGQSATGLAPVTIAVDQEEPPSILCSGGNNPYICRILTTGNAPAYFPGDAIPRTEFVVIEYYPGY